jgi:hypothetical protein
MRNREESKGKKYLLGRTGEDANGAAAGEQPRKTTQPPFNRLERCVVKHVQVSDGPCEVTQASAVLSPIKLAFPQGHVCVFPYPSGSFVVSPKALMLRHCRR